MEITKDNAMNIVRDISYITGSNVNLMNIEGIIIASTDATRIGTFHEASKQVMEKRLEKLVVYDNFTYEGSKKGINMPLVINGEICGVVGISGSSEEVIKYGEIVKKMTEILLLENRVKQEKISTKEMIEHFVIDWIFSKNKEGIQERGHRLGINISKDWRIMLIQIQDVAFHQKNNVRFSILEEVEKSIRSVLGYVEYVLVNSNSIFILMIPEATQNRIMELGTTIKDAVWYNQKLSIIIGIDEISEELHISYQKAERALKRSSTVNPVTMYKDLHLEMFMHEISEQTKNEFIAKVFKNHSEKDMSKTLKLLRAYFDSDGSITKTAENMLVHKNTLQYKLKNLHEKTGIDPRAVTGATLFQLALAFYDSV